MSGLTLLRTHIIFFFPVKCNIKIHVDAQILLEFLFLFFTLRLHWPIPGTGLGLIYDWLGCDRKEKKSTTVIRQARHGGCSTYSTNEREG
jgi:hypothetical protein